MEAPLEAVQAALDHSNLATPSIYVRQLEGQEDPWWPKLAEAGRPSWGWKEGEKRPHPPRSGSERACSRSASS